MNQEKHERSTTDLVRAAVSGWLGTALEFMDFQLYSLGAALVFHEIFFTNDLWLFDPAEDYMIRMLPEGFFYDMALRIGGIFIISMLIFLAVSVFLARQAKKGENERKIKSTYE